MTDTGDGQPLLGGSGGEQRPGAAEEYLFQFFCLQLTQKIPAEGNGAAAAAGTAAVNILGGVVKDQRAAVRQLSAQTDAVPAGKLHQHFFAKLPQIAGDDQIEGFRPCFQIFKMSFQPIAM